MTLAVLPLLRRRSDGWLPVLLLAWLLPGLLAAHELLVLFKSPLTALWQHAVVLMVVFLALLLLFAGDIFQGGLSRLQCAAWATLLAVCQFALFGFYGLSAVGHEHWGDWINWDLAWAYLPQVPGLLDALEVSKTGVAVALLALLAGQFGLYFFLTCALVLPGKQPSVASVPAPAMTDAAQRTGLALLIAMTLSLMWFSRSYVTDTGYWWHEPLRQASRRGSFGEAGKGQFFNPERLKQEREAIAAYQPPLVGVKPRPLVVIIVDALRSDQMGVYGAPFDNTPFLSSLAKAGRLQRVDDVYSVCTLSYCGILGTLSSKYWHQLTPQPWNLADALKKFGYENRFLLSGDHTSYYGLRQMFGSAVDLIRDGSDQSRFYNNDDRLVLKALDDTGWPTTKPGFMYIHLMSVHRLGRMEDQYKRWTADNAPTHSSFAVLDAAQSPATRARYHNGILQADEMIRQIFQRLEQLKVLDDALVMITADHGEFLGEMGRWSHGQAPFEPVVRVPWLIYDRAGAAAYPARALASQVDIAPTLLQAIGAQVPANWSGVALQVSSTRSALVVESNEASGVVAMVDGKRFKFLRPTGGRDEQLFELSSGPGAETRNLAPQVIYSQVLGQLRALHNQMTSGH